MPTVQGAIKVEWNALGGANSVLGQPVTDELTTADGVGRFNNFQGGVIYWTPQTGAHAVSGLVLAEWETLGKEQGLLGYPTSDEIPAGDGLGFVSHFRRGSIYYTGQTGAHEVHGAIGAKWDSLGGVNSPLGYPATDEAAAPASGGRFNDFQNGSIYWSPQTGAHEFHGAIRAKFVSLGFGQLGFPTTDETATPDGIGRFNHFQVGSIYWTPQTDAHAVFGAIRDKWASLNYEQGPLGYPVSDQQPTGNGAVSQFQHGSITYTTQTGAVANIIQPVQFPINVPQVVKQDGSTTATGSAKISQQAANGLIELNLHVHKAGLSGVGVASAMMALLDAAGNTLFKTGPVDTQVGANDDPFNNPGVADKDSPTGDFDVPLNKLLAARQWMLVVIASDNDGLAHGPDDLTHVVNHVASLLQAGESAAQAIVGIAEAAVEIAALAE